MSDLPLHRTMQDDEIDRLKARVAELEDALVWALGKLSIEVPVTGGNVSYIRAFEKADKALSSDGRAYLLRKQAEAINQAINNYFNIDSGPHSLKEHLEWQAQRLRDQADEAERAGGQK